MTSAHMIQFIKSRHPQWLEAYLASKKSVESGHAALTRLCQRFAWRCVLFPSLFSSPLSPRLPPSPLHPASWATAS